MIGTDELAALFFELSSASRLDILLLLNKQDCKMSQISKDLNQTVQETSRHLTRLCDAKLVEKLQDGLYTPTPYGKQILRFIPSITFLLENSDFFSTHEFSMVPEQYQYGFGHIESYQRSDHVMESFRYTEELIKKAERFIWILSDQVLSSTQPLIQEAVRRGVEFRLILPKEVADEEDGRAADAELPEELQKLIQQRFPGRVDMVIVMSESEAILAFPDLSGKMDYAGISVTGNEGVSWCKQIFLHFWEKAK